MSWQERLASARVHRDAAAEAGTTQELQSANGHWAAALEMRDANVQRVTIRDIVQSKPLRFGDVITLWEQDLPFKQFFTTILGGSPFNAFFFECPPVSRSTISTRMYEHVTVRAHSFRHADPAAFSAHLDSAEPSVQAISFANLGGDATLVSPTFRGLHASYGHLAAFVRHGESKQQIAFWQTVGTTLRQTLERQGTSLTWLNTEGSGVPWLHMRMDSSPKYYHFHEYSRPESAGAAIHEG